MRLLIFVIGWLTLPSLDQSLAARIRDMTNRALLGQSESEEAAINKEVRDIYVQYGLLSASQVGDEAAYDFIFLLTGQPRSIQREALGKIDKNGKGFDVPADAITFLRARLRLEGIKNESRTKPPSELPLRDENNRLYQSDQAVRQQEGFDPEKLAETDRRHAEGLRRILQEHGLPTYSMVGPEAAGHFVVMIQHQSPQMRDLVLPALRAGVEKGQADPESYALVYDLTQIDKGKKQYFGERLICQSGELREAPIEDEEHVNQRRAELGLMRIELYSYLVSRIMPQMCSATPPR